MRSRYLTQPLLAILSAVFILQPLYAQKREDILSIQRDVAQLQDQLTQMRTDQDQKLTAIQNMLRQALDESSRLSSTVATLERTMNERLNQQQARTEVPLSNIGVKVDQVSDDVRATRENVTDLTKRVNNLDSKLADISSAIRTINAPPPPPPSPVAAPSGPAVPAGVTPDSLWQSATRDKLGGKDELALSEFNDYVKFFPQSENAPAAQYQIGDIYWKAKQYDDAVLAFDAVLERYPENPKSPDALYLKGAALMNIKARRADAIVEFKDFLARYPSHALAPKARDHLRELGASTTAMPRSKKRAN